MNIGDLVDQGWAEIKTGPFGTQLHASEYSESGRPVLNVRNIGFGDIREDKLEYVDEETAKRLNMHLLRKGDIVFGRKGAVERHAYVGASFEGAMQGSDCIRLRVSSQSPVKAAFLTFALRTQQHRDWMIAICSGATMASLNQEVVRHIPIPVVALPQQDEIIEILQSIDDLIENNRRRVALLEEMAREIYREWFVRYRFPGHEDVPMVDSSLGRVPDGWTATTVGAISSAVTRGIAPHYSDHGPWTVLNQKCIRDGRVSLGPARAQDRPVPPAKQVQHGDVLVNSTGVGTLGRVSMYRGNHDALTVDSHVSIVRPSDVVLNPWYGLTLAAKSAEFEQLSTGSTGQTELSRGAIGSVPLVVPNRRLLEAFSDIAWPLLNPTETLLEQTDVLATMRDLLLPKLVTGQIDVSSLDLCAHVSGDGAG